MKQEIITLDINKLKPFSEAEAQLAKLEEEAKSLTFEYDTKQGNADARSHIHSIRGIKGSLEKRRKDVKAGAIAFGKAVDKQAGEIRERLDGIISVHEKPLLEIEQKKKERIAAAQAIVARFRNYAMPMPDATCEKYQDRLDDIAQTQASEFYQNDMPDYRADADTAAETSKASLLGMIAAIEEQAKKDAELEELRQKQAEADAIIAAQEKADEEKNKESAPVETVVLPTTLDDSCNAPDISIGTTEDPAPNDVIEASITPTAPAKKPIEVEISTKSAMTLAFFQGGLSPADADLAAQLVLSGSIPGITLADHSESLREAS